MKKKNSKTAIQCLSNYGPIFGNNTSDIAIANDCNEEDSCYITCPSRFQYECHSEYKSSLYVNTNGSDYVNYFSVLDYEVYTYNYLF